MDNENVIDYLIEEEEKKCLIIISVLTEKGEREQIKYLQNKINRYLYWIETEQLEQFFPNAKRGYKIRVLYKYQLNDTLINFFISQKSKVMGKGYEIEYIKYENSYDLFEQT